MLYGMDEEVVVNFLKTSRKARKQATCYPCQRRKVKCDRGSPCKVCVSRGQSFLCSYGRQTEDSSATLLGVPTTTDFTKGTSNESSTIEASDITVLRKELDKLRHEAHQTRTRHRRCQAAQTESRRLRARCKKFEAMFASLKAGDWTAMSRLDQMIDNMVDVDGEVTSCSQSQDESDIPNLVSTGSSVSATCESSLLESMNHDSATGHLRVSQYRAARPSFPGRRSDFKPPSPNMSTGISNLRLTHNSDSSASSASTESADPAEGNMIHAPVLQSRGGRNGMLFTTPVQVTNPGHGQQRIMGIIADQHRATSSMMCPQECFAMSAPYQTEIVAVTHQYQEHEPQKGLETPYPSVVEASTPPHGPLIPETMNVFPDSFWLQNTSYPPMAFTQYTDLMERSYADYCSRIVVKS